MNIQHGDKLAYITHGVLNPDNVNRIVEILRPAVEGEQFEFCGRAVRTNTQGHPSWWVRCASPLAWTGEGKTNYVHERYILDSLLRPIRDPGDDAQDETLTWLPSPAKEVAHG